MGPVFAGALIFASGVILGVILMSIAVAAGRNNPNDDLKVVNVYGEGNVRLLPRNDQEEGGEEGS